MTPSRGLVTFTFRHFRPLLPRPSHALRVRNSIFSHNLTSNVAFCSSFSSNMTGQKKDPVWRPDDGLRPAPAKPGSTELFRPDVLETIEKRISEADEELRSLSLDIHGEF